MRIIEYTASRLTFYSDRIEELDENDYFIVNVTNDNASYKMTKNEFYETFFNVVNSISYKENGNYNYLKTPKKAFKYIV